LTENGLLCSDLHASAKKSSRGVLGGGGGGPGEKTTIRIGDRPKRGEPIGRRDWGKRGGKAYLRSSYQAGERGGREKMRGGVTLPCVGDETDFCRFCAMEGGKSRNHLNVPRSEKGHCQERRRGGSVLRSSYKERRNSSYAVEVSILTMMKLGRKKKKRGEKGDRRSGFAFPFLSSISDRGEGNFLFLNRRESEREKEKGGGTFCTLAGAEGATGTPRESGGFFLH